MQPAPGPVILILADDLSGAADCAVAFAGRGNECRVAVAMDEAGEAFAGADVVALDLDTRRMDVDDARTVTRRAAAVLGTPGSPLIFKKIDSTLRGHVFTELAETLAAAPAGAMALLAPAFPVMGRTTLAGRVYVRGVPLEETETWRHAGFTGQADLAGMAAGSGLRAARVGLETIRRGADALREELERLGASGTTDVVVCDAVEPDDLLAVAAAGAALRPRPLLVGSAGLAHALAATEEVWSNSERNGKSNVDAMTTAASSAEGNGPVLIVVGSASSISRDQAQALEKAGARGVCVAPEALREGSQSADWVAASESLGQALAAGEDVVCTLGAGGEDLDFSEGHFLSEQLAAFVAPHLENLGGLVATGGETARSLLKLLGVRGLQLEREVEPGVALGRTEGGALPRPLRVITKAGAFGNVETLVHCREALRGTHDS